MTIIATPVEIGWTTTLGLVSLQEWTSSEVVGSVLPAVKPRLVGVGHDGRVPIDVNSGSLEEISGVIPDE